MPTVSSAEFQKRFGTFGEAAQREPVTITNHGRESLVLLSATEYRRLKALDTRRAFHPSELPTELAEALETAEPPSWTTAFDAEMKP